LELVSSSLYSDASIEHIPVYLRGDKPELLKIFGITAPKDPCYKKPIPPLKG
jgi:hypothetical protein